MFRLKRSKADILFSNYIRARANWTCERCHTQYSPPTSGLHCSHFFGRSNKAVRWDTDNASALCWGCHQRLGSQPVEHTEFFIKRLGQKKYDALVLRAHIPTKIDQKLVVIQLEMLLKEIVSKEPHVFGKRAE